MIKKILSLLILTAILGCHGNAGVQSAYFQTYPVPGTQEPFDLIIDNESQFPIIPNAIIFPGPSGLPIPTGQVLIIPPGTVAKFPIGFLPSSIGAIAETTSVPPFIFNVQNFNVGIDYSYFANSVIVTFR